MGITTAHDFAECCECGEEFDLLAEGGIADCDALCGDCYGETPQPQKENSRGSA